MSKFITRLLRHSQKVYRGDDGRKAIENTGFWSDEMKKQFVNAQHVDRKNGISSGKRWRTEGKVSILLESEQSSSILVLSSSPRAFRKYNQSYIARQCAGYQKVLIPGGVSLNTGRQAVFFTVVDLMDDQDGLGEFLCDLLQARIAPYRNTWTPFQNTVFWCNLKLAQQRGLQFYQNKIKRSYSLRHTVCRVH